MNTRTINIIERAQRIYTGISDRNAVSFRPSANATAVDAWNRIKNKVSEYALADVGGSLPRTTVSDFGMLETVHERFECDNKKILLKKDRGIWQPKKLVGKNWQLPDVAECVSALSSLPFPCVYARVIGGGDIINFSFDLGGSDIGGENVQRYVNAFISQKHNVSHSFMTSAMNGFCMNAFFMTFSLADVGFKISHNAAAAPSQYLAFVADLQGRLIGQADSMTEFLEKLTRRYIDYADVESVLEKTYPYPSTPGSVVLNPDKFEDLLAKMRIDGAHSKVLDTLDKSTRDYATTCGRQDARRDLVIDAMRRYEATDKRPFAGTAYHLYQGITEASTWRTGMGNIGDSVLAGERRTEIQNGAEAVAELIRV